MGIKPPADLAFVWIETLEKVDDTGLLDTIAWVDLCNEFPNDDRASLFNHPDDDQYVRRRSPAARRWVNESIAQVRQAHPELDYSVSGTAGVSTGQAGPFPGTVAFSTASNSESRLSWP
jgi:hypothetical protein